MKLIEQNPFRILGVTVDAGAKEISANLRKKQLIDIGKDVVFSTDMPAILPPITRTSAMIEEANGKLCMSEEKIKHALFWFAKPKSESGTIAFKLLTEGTIKAKDITFGGSWEEELCRSVKRLIESEYHVMALNDRCEKTGDCSVTFERDGFLRSLNAISSVIENHNIEFCHAVVDETCSYTSAELRHLYISMLATECDMFKLLDCYDKEYQLYFDEIREFAMVQSTELIEKELSSVKSVSKDDEKAQLKAGKRLKDSTQQALSRLLKLYSQADSPYGMQLSLFDTAEPSNGTHTITNYDIRYSRLADRVTDQILQCSIKAHNIVYDRNEFFVPLSILKKCMDLAEYARQLCVGEKAKKYISEQAGVLRAKYERQMKRVERERQQTSARPSQSSSSSPAVSIPATRPTSNASSAASSNSQKTNNLQYKDWHGSSSVTGDNTPTTNSSNTTGSVEQMKRNLQDLRPPTLITTRYVSETKNNKSSKSTSESEKNVDSIIAIVTGVLITVGSLILICSIPEFFKKQKIETYDYRNISTYYSEPIRMDKELVMYNTIIQKYGKDGFAPTYEEFATDMRDTTYRRGIYDMLSADYELPNFMEWKRSYGY